ncbi:hypothetical protein [Nonomuraea africana]|uniref:Uncharacterized protein n=1 Tax=Nonomuraea africana TaxID=46171 RepID=A0ABR9KQ68_9ACTN|nr:hypothetical protein [Nonomuraea africana]MBE1563667.1 hypothetical protein [Nonomuraea africana]
MNTPILRARASRSRHWHGPAAQRPPRFEQEEALDEQPIARQAAARATPPSAPCWKTWRGPTEVVGQRRPQSETTSVAPGARLSSRKVRYAGGRRRNLTLK